METERIALSQPERDRLKVLHEVQQKQLTQVAGATTLKISATRMTITAGIVQALALTLRTLTMHLNPV